MKKNNFLLILILFILGYEIETAEAQILPTINSIFIERKDVFSKEDNDWFSGADLFNSIHTLTKEYIIRNELLFNINDTLSEELFLESERNLRATELFTNVKIELEEVSNNLFDVYVVTKDRWSLFPSILFGSSGKDLQYGAKLEEFNLLGTGTYLVFSGLYRNEYDIGWEGEFGLKNKRIFGTNFNVEFDLLSNSFLTKQNLKIEKPYRTFHSKNAYGVSIQNNFGKEMFLNNPEKLFQEIEAIPIREQVYQGWYSQAWLVDESHVYFTGLVEYDKVNRGYEIFQRAYDNQGKILAGFSSSLQNFYAVECINSYSVEDIEDGGWGTVILGKTFPIAHYGGERGFFYTAAQGERSIFTKNLYLFGQASGASSFRDGYAKYTFQSFVGKGFYRFNNKLLFAAQIQEQAVWSWPKYRQLILDETRGLRGYNIGGFAGDNRLISNFELRYFPGWQLFVFKLSGALFYDIGSVWNRTVEIFESKFYSSLGAGIRLHFTKSNNPLHTIRIDFPYNFHTKSFAVSFGSSQYFEAFSKHQFRLPEMFGTEFDYE